MNFEDYGESDLRTIWMKEIEHRDVSCDDATARIATKRLAKSSGKKGFGNARAVRSLVSCNVLTIRYLA